MITLFDSTASQYLNITEFKVNPVFKWIGGVVLSGAISWAGWSTNELMKAKSAAEDVKAAIVHLDGRFNSIDRRLERIESMLMSQGGKSSAR